MATATMHRTWKLLCERGLIMLATGFFGMIFASIAGMVVSVIALAVVGTVAGFDQMEASNPLVILIVGGVWLYMMSVITLAMARAARHDEVGSDGLWLSARQAWRMFPAALIAQAASVLGMYEVIDPIVALCVAVPATWLTYLVAASIAFGDGGGGPDAVIAHFHGRWGTIAMLVVIGTPVSLGMSIVVEQLPLLGYYSGGWLGTFLMLALTCAAWFVVDEDAAQIREQQLAARREREEAERRAAYDEAVAAAQFAPRHSVDLSSLELAIERVGELRPDAPFAEWVHLPDGGAMQATLLWPAATPHPPAIHVANEAHEWIHAEQTGESPAQVVLGGLAPGWYHWYVSAPQTMRLSVSVYATPFSQRAAA